MTHLHEPEQLIALADAITVQSVAEEALRSCSITDKVGVVLQEMNEKDIDIFPVDESGRYKSYVARTDLAVADTDITIAEIDKKVIGVEDVIPMRSSLLEALQLLAVREWLFCIAGNSVTGIVTRGDLQRVSARMYFFAVVTSFEDFALDAIQTAFNNDEWDSLDDFPADPLRSARAEFRKRKARNEEPSSLAECLMFGGKVAALRRTPLWEASLSQHDVADEASNEGSSPKGALDSLVTLRNNLAHGWDLTKGLPRRWAEVLWALDAAHAMMRELQSLGGEPNPA